MRIPALTTTFALALVVAACGGNSADEATNNLSSEVNLVDAPPALPTDAAGFAKAVAESDQFELESAKLALAKSASAGVKSIAQMIEREHTQSTADLKAAAGTLAVTPALDAEKQAMLDKLTPLTGAEFDREFLSQQRVAHQKVSLLLQNYGQAGDNPALKAFTKTAQSVVDGHIDALNQIPQ